MPVATSRYEFKFVVLGRYPARLPGTESQITVNLASGHEGHLTHSGTLTLSEGEWESFLDALRNCLKDAVEVEDFTVPPPEWSREAPSH
jgi:hypothetical protein